MSLTFKAQIKLEINGYSQPKHNYIKTQPLAKFKQFLIQLQLTIVKPNQFLQTVAADSS